MYMHDQACKVEFFLKIGKHLNNYMHNKKKQKNATHIEKIAPHKEKKGFPRGILLEISLALSPCRRPCAQTTLP